MKYSVKDFGEFVWTISVSVSRIQGNERVTLTVAVGERCRNVDAALFSSSDDSYCTTQRQ